MLASRPISGEDALYVLPFDGRRVCVQGNDGVVSHHDDQRYAFDFLMPTGTTVYAARAGRVVATRADKDGNGFDAPANYVKIEHEDGTVARYLHLMKDGVLVKVGAAVEVGDPVGLSGNTGRSLMPHLHFDVLDAMGGKTIPVRFRDGGDDGLPVTGGIYKGQASSYREERERAEEPAKVSEPF